MIEHGEMPFQRLQKSEPLIKTGALRIQNIINSSKEREDIIHIELESLPNCDFKGEIKCHKACASTHTSRIHIS